MWLLSRHTESPLGPSPQVFKFVLVRQFHCIGCSFSADSAYIFVHTRHPLRQQFLATAWNAQITASSDVATHLAMEEPVGRSRRAVRPASKAAGALAQLAELRRTGVKHVNAYEYKEEDAVFDVVAEDDYADIVARRRGDAGAQRRAC